MHIITILSLTLLFPNRPVGISHWHNHFARRPQKKRMQGPLFALSVWDTPARIICARARAPRRKTHETLKVRAPEKCSHAGASRIMSLSSFFWFFSLYSSSPFFVFWFRTVFSSLLAWTLPVRPSGKEKNDDRELRWKFWKISERKKKETRRRCGTGWGHLFSRLTSDALAHSPTHVETTWHHPQMVKKDTEETFSRWNLVSQLRFFSSSSNFFLCLTFLSWFSISVVSYLTFFYIYWKMEEEAAGDMRMEKK